MKRLMASLLLASVSMASADSSLEELIRRYDMAPTPTPAPRAAAPAPKAVEADAWTGLLEGDRRSVIIVLPDREGDAALLRRRLLAASPALKKAVESGRVRLRLARCEPASGRVQAVD